MNPYLANFWHGVRIATFRRVDPADMRTDWAAFWIGLAFVALVEMVASYFAAEPPVYFNLDALQYLSLGAMGYLACGFAGALMLHQQDIQRRLPVLVIYAGMLPLLVNAVLYEAMRMPWWAQEEDLWAFYGFILTWLFLAYCRALDLCVPAQAVLKQYVLAGLAVGVMAVPPYYMYVEDFFETDYSDYDPHSPFDDLSAETLLQGQHRVLDSVLGQLSHGKKGQLDSFVVSFGAYGSQDVFMKEAGLARDVFLDWFGTNAQGVALVNNPETAKQNLPLATATNLQDTLSRMGRLANRDEDLLVLYMTSHGYRSGTLSVDMGPIPLNEIPPMKLREMLDQSGFKWRVVIVSACFSGGMIKTLKNDFTIVMTAAASDKMSFGCSDDADLTYFGRALLEDALPGSPDLIAAFEKARAVVAAREKAEQIKLPSDPQIFVGEAIGKMLDIE